VAGFAWTACLFTATQYPADFEGASWVGRAAAEAEASRRRLRDTGE
jgi:hypothetical protein